MITERVQEILLKCNTEASFLELSDDDKEALDNEIKKNKRLSCDNKFLGRNEEIIFWVFNLPRILTCPERTKICEKECYQGPVENILKGKGKNSHIVNSRKLNWYMSMKDDFSERILGELSRKRKTTTHRYVRIHADGDFYSKDYMAKWFTIALASKLKGLDYIFVAYTKSFSILKGLLSDKEKLSRIFKDAHDLAKIAMPVISGELSLDEFNIHIIASKMDDTDKMYPLAQGIIEKYELPVYTVTEKDIANLEKCGNTENPCVNCMKCYKFQENDIKTKLRKSNKNNN